MGLVENNQNRDKDQIYPLNADTFCETTRRILTIFQLVLLACYTRQTALTGIYNPAISLSLECEYDISLEMSFECPSGSWSKTKTMHNSEGNNRSDFPKGSDTGAEINCTFLKMNKSICAVIK